MSSGPSFRVSFVDAFASPPFQGNPAAVCLLREEAPRAWMQALARKIGFSETAFLRREGGAFRLRWFTPRVEVGLCGHATLASAHALWESGALASSRPALFRTRSGTLRARRRGDWIELDFPSVPTRAAKRLPRLEAALGLEGAARSLRKGPYAFLVELGSERELRSLRPDFARLCALGRDVVVTAPARRAGFDFVSRYFAPAEGIDEDPVTGSAHCMLGPFWGARLGKTRLRGWQASARGGEVRVVLRGHRVLLLGRCQTSSYSSYSDGVRRQVIQVIDSLENLNNLTSDTVTRYTVTYGRRRRNSRPSGRRSCGCRR